MNLEIENNIIKTVENNGMKFEDGKTYKINPEFDAWETDTYRLSDWNCERNLNDGLYFVRYIDGNEDNESEKSSWFSWYNLLQGELIEVE